MSDTTVRLELTGSQRMALTMIVGEYLRTPGHTEVFVDVSRGGTETLPEDLLALLMDARPAVVSPVETFEPAAADDEPDVEILAALTRELEAHEAPLTFVLRPAVAFQLASLLQLALRHHAVSPSLRSVASVFIEHVRQYFLEEGPTVSLLLTQGNDRAYDTRSPASPAMKTAMRVAVEGGAGHDCEEWTEDGRCQLCGRPLALRIRYRERGGHVSCHVFTAPAVNETFAKVGELWFSIAEWPLLVAWLEPAGVQFVLDED